MKGQVCIVTGAGSGIGEATAIKLAAMGAVTVLVGRTQAKLDAVHDRIEAAGGASHVIAADVTSLDDIQRIVDSTLQEHGRIDVLINNAGFSSRNRTTLTLTPEEADAVIRVNLIGPMFLTQAAMPAMIEAGTGTIVNVASVAGKRASLLSGPIYGPAKAGILSYTEYLVQEFANTGVRACAVSPGEVDTPIMANRPVVPSDEARATMLTSDDVADAIVLAVSAPPSSMVSDIVVMPNRSRDYTAEIGDPFPDT